MRGRVKNWYPERFFGFIEVEGGQIWFFHGTAVEPDYRIRTHDKVEFWLDDDPYGRGLVAVAVRPHLPEAVRYG